MKGFAIVELVKWWFQHGTLTKGMDLLKTHGHGGAWNSISQVMLLEGSLELLS